MSTDLPIIIRPYQEGDKNFILDSWHRSDRDGGHWSVMDHSEYMRKIKRSYERILYDSQILVACLDTIDWQIFGYCITEPKKNILWWLFVKSPYRRFGIGQYLLKASIPKLFQGEDFTTGCHTVKMSKYTKSLRTNNETLGDLRYNPKHIVKIMR